MAGRAQSNDTFTFILFLFFLFCVKVPYSVEKFHTVKYLKNFNVKISMKFSRQENFMKFYIDLVQLKHPKIRVE